MLTRSSLLRVATTGTKTTTKDIAKQPATASSVPAVSPAVVRSLYRSLYREVTRLDKEPVLKVLFPCNHELQSVLGVPGPLHVPGCQRYTDVLRNVFRDATRIPKINLAFDTLNRLRAHYENVKAKLPAMDKERTQLLASLRSSAVAERRKSFFRAQPIRPTPGAGPRYVQAAPGVPTRVVLREVRHNLDLCEGTLLLAHPLSSAHVDRRVMLITECTPILTSALVLDLQFTYPLSRGNSMFPEVFWGHDVYDGGFSQIGFTMPPTAQIAVLHTLESHDTVANSSESSSGESSVMSWLKWKGPPNTGGTDTSHVTATPAGSCSPEAVKKHGLFCRPLIPGGVLDNGAREPTLYLSKAEALPYLAELAKGQPRSSLRVYWGNMRWTTSQLEAEVASGHWMPVKTSPSFFRAYALSATSDDAAERFPTAAQLAEAKQLREKRYGADITPPQVFPPDQIMRRRECLWDEIMFALGGEYAALVGCSNPFSDSPRWSSLQILAPHMSPLPLSTEGDERAAAAEVGVAAAADEALASEVVLDEDTDESDDDDDKDELDETVFVPGTSDILEHKITDTEPQQVGHRDVAPSAPPPSKKDNSNHKDGGDSA
ncbi:putative ACR, COG1678 [Leishmania naiffi]|uniref:ACR, COG1678 n=1 Tax=Leishmania naiffi TaxID=5678 RepID=A0AAW3BKN3_9TRYP